jgi:hypothetical protein
MSHEDHLLTGRPEVGDYVLAQTGGHWVIQRNNGDGTSKNLPTPEADEESARTRVLKLASDDVTTAWELIDLEVFRLLQTFRP